MIFRGQVCVTKDRLGRGTVFKKAVVAQAKQVTLTLPLLLDWSVRLLLAEMYFPQHHALTALGVGPPIAGGVASVRVRDAWRIRNAVLQRREVLYAVSGRPILSSGHPHPNFFLAVTLALAASFTFLTPSPPVASLRSYQRLCSGDARPGGLSGDDVSKRGV